MGRPRSGAPPPSTHCPGHAPSPPPLRLRPRVPHREAQEPPGYEPRTCSCEPQRPEVRARGLPLARPPHPRTSIRPAPCPQSANQRVTPALPPLSRGGCGPRGVSTPGLGCSRGGDLRGTSPSPRALLQASATSYPGFLPPDFCRVIFL